jgi:hypothetical protein
MAGLYTGWGRLVMNAVVSVVMGVDILSPALYVT